MDVTAATMVVPLLSAALFPMPATISSVSIPEETVHYAPAPDFTRVSMTGSSLIPSMQAPQCERFDARKAAFELFGEMRNPNKEEAALYRSMKKRLGTPVGTSVFSL